MQPVSLYSCPSAKVQVHPLYGEKVASTTTTNFYLGVQCHIYRHCGPHHYGCGTLSSGTVVVKFVKSERSVGSQQIKVKATLTWKFKILKTTRILI